MVRIIVRIMRKNYMGLWNYETMGVIELQNYRTIELQRISLKSYRELGVRSIGVVKELLREQREVERGRERQREVERGRERQREVERGK